MTPEQARAGPKTGRAGYGDARRRSGGPGRRRARLRGRRQSQTFTGCCAGLVSPPRKLKRRPRAGSGGCRAEGRGYRDRLAHSDGVVSLGQGRIPPPIRPITPPITIFEDRAASERVIPLLISHKNLRSRLQGHCSQVRKGSLNFPPHSHSMAGLGGTVTFMEQMAPVVDDTIRALSNVRFVEDPIAGVKYSRATSIVSSAYKRHGRILEMALLESLRESNRHKVWNDQLFKVSHEADALANTQDLVRRLPTNYATLRQFCKNPASRYDRFR